MREIKHCKRCNRLLKSARSLKNDMGATCARKWKEAEEKAAKQGQLKLFEGETI